MFGRIKKKRNRFKGSFYSVKYFLLKKMAISGKISI